MHDDAINDLGQRGFGPLEPEAHAGRPMLLRRADLVSPNGSDGWQLIRWDRMGTGSRCILEEAGQCVWPARSRYVM
jgi:hypothetical protein